MRRIVSNWRYLTLAMATANLIGIGGAAAFQNNQDAQFRAQVRQQMELRSLKQRIANERASQRAQQAAERANQAARRARRRAKSKITELLLARNDQLLPMAHHLARPRRASQIQASGRTG